MSPNTMRQTRLSAQSFGSGENQVSTSPSQATKRRRSDDESSSTKETPTAMVKKRKTTAKERSANDPHHPVSNLVDSLRPGLTLVFIGLNPGIETAKKGHAYAHASNLFWKLLHWSGVTPKQHKPSETYDMMDLYSMGNTNICARPTRSGIDLKKEEMIEGAGILESKIQKYRPEAVCIVGKGIWETIYKAKTGKAIGKAFEYGWQEEHLWLGRIKASKGAAGWSGSRTFVATTTSGLYAGMSTEQKTKIMKPLGDWFTPKRIAYCESVSKENNADDNGGEDEQTDGVEESSWVQRLIADGG